MAKNRNAARIEYLCNRVLQWALTVNKQPVLIEPESLATLPDAVIRFIYYSIVRLGPEASGPYSLPVKGQEALKVIIRAEGDTTGDNEPIDPLVMASKFALRFALDGLIEHEQTEHGNAVCKSERINLVGYVAAGIGLDESDMPLVIERMNYWLKTYYAAKTS